MVKSLALLICILLVSNPALAECIHYVFGLAPGEYDVFQHETLLLSHQEAGLSGDLSFVSDTPSPILIVPSVLSHLDSHQTSKPPTSSTVLYDVTGRYVGTSKEFSSLPKGVYFYASPLGGGKLVVR